MTKKFQIAHGTGDPDQSRVDGSMSGGASCSSGQGLKRTAGQAGLPEDADVSYPQGIKRADFESTESGMEPDARRQKISEGTASTTMNDADFDIQVAEANTSSSDDPSSRLSSTASVCWKGEKHVRRNQVVDAFRSDCVDIDEKEAQEISSLLLEIGSVTRDCENPQRIAVSQCEKLGLRPGFVVDLNDLKPWTGIAWSLCNPKGGDELMDFLDREDPEFVIGGSPCDCFRFLERIELRPEKSNRLSCMCARLSKTTSQGQGSSARSTNQINFVEKQGHLMDRIISRNFQDQGSNLSVESLQKTCEFCWFHSTGNLLDDE